MPQRPLKLSLDENPSSLKSEGTLLSPRSPLRETTLQDPTTMDPSLQSPQDPANPPHPLQEPSDSATPTQSILERMPNEVLCKIFLMSHNLFLLDACHKIRSALSADIYFDDLVLLAFGRSGVCERHQTFTHPSHFCTFCRDGDGHAEEVNKDYYAPGVYDPILEGIDPLEYVGDADDLERDSYGERRYCGLNPFKGSRGGRVREAECVIAIPEKRILQQQIMQRSWFSRRHIEMVENACRNPHPCVQEYSRAQRRIVKIVSAEDCVEYADYDFSTDKPEFGHRRHILHGVSLPRRLLDIYDRLSDDQMYLFETLLEWSADWTWAQESCKRVKGKVLVAGSRAISLLIHRNRLNGLRLLLDEWSVGRPPNWRTNLGLEVTWLTIRRALERRASQRLIHTLLSASFSAGEEAPGLDYWHVLHWAEQMKVHGGHDEYWT